MSEIAEKTILCSLILNPGKIGKIGDMLTIDDFTNPLAGAAFGAMMTLHNTGQPVTVPAIYQQATAPGLGAYLSGLIASLSELACPFPAKIIPGLLSDSREYKVAAAVKEAAAAKTIDEKIRALGAVRDLDNRRLVNFDAAGQIEELEAEIDADLARDSFGVSLGYADLDEANVLLGPGKILAVAAYTSIGKTAFACQLVANMLHDRTRPPVVFISVEMTRREILGRLIGNLAGIPSGRINRRRYFSAEEADQAARARTLLQGAELLVVDDVYTLPAIEALLARLKIAEGVVVFDYFQNIQVAGNKGEYEASAERAKRLQIMAKQLGCGFIVLSQIPQDAVSNPSEQFRAKGGGDLGAVTDYGVTLRRPKTNKHDLLAMLQKNRHGPIGDYRFEYRMDYSQLYYHGPA